jgi:hypothetical protein
VAFAGLIVLAATFIVLNNRSTFSNVEGSVYARTDMAARALAMFSEHPVFGIGPGRFYEVSTRYSRPSDRPTFVRENAHNNFLQVLTELGLAGFIPLLWLLVAVLYGARRPVPQDEAWAMGLSAGVVGFVATWLAGHPLLTREVSLAFWLVLGLVASCRPACAAAVSAPKAHARRWLPAGIVLIMVALVPVVAERRLAGADLTRDGRGFSQWHKAADEVRYRWMFRRAVLYVPADASVVGIGLRSPDSAAAVRVLVEGRIARELVVGGEAWQEVAVDVPRGYGWKSFPVEIRVRSYEGEDAARRQSGAGSRLQVALPRVLR